MTDFIAGWFGGVSVLVVGQPFDSVKYRLQGSNLDYRNVGYRNSMDCAIKTFQSEGLVGFYRGVGAAIAGVGIARAALFGVYGHLLAFFSSRYDTTTSEKFQGGAQLSLLENMLCAAGGGVAHSVVMTPFEVVRIRLQTMHMFKDRKYFDELHCARTLYREGGARKLYRGLTATLMRDVPGSITYLGCYGILRQLLPQQDGALNTMSVLFAGGCAGVAQWSIIFPLDTIKTRMQIARSGVYTDVMHVARDLWRTEGLHAFYYGIAPAICKAFLSNALCFLGVETALKVLGESSD